MLTDPRGVNALTGAIIGCGVTVHRVIGPGLLESIYSECMQHELRVAGLRYEVERHVPLVYRGHRLNGFCYTDLIVEGRVVVELKAVSQIVEIHRRQVLTQLRLLGLHIGLILNFNVVTLTDGGVKRIVNSAATCDALGPPP